MDNEQSFSSKLLPAFLVVLAVALLLFISLLFNRPSAIETWKIEEKKCGSCHEMKPQLYTWQQTAHSRIACTSCHVESSLASMTFKSKTGTYNTPIKSAYFISDEICLGCHTPERQISPPNGLIIPHSLHTTKGVDCIDCHRNVAHAEVTDKVIATSQKDIAAFSPQDAKALSAFGNRIPMATCMRCHNGAKASEECAACHTNKPIPQNHFVPVWGTGHGSTALKELDSCNFCHEYDVEKQQTAQVKNNDYASLQTYAKRNEFCRDCHEKRPAAHDNFFSVNHRFPGKSKNDSCYVCHNYTPDPVIQPTTDVYCGKCHEGNTTHDNDWVSKHKHEARSDNAQACFSCHNTNSCTKCHTVMLPPKELQ